MKGTCIAVTSGKGGVGKSTVSVNLAYQLAQQGKKVAIVDADIYGFSVPSLLNITEKPVTFNGKIAPVKALDMEVMSMGFFVENNDAIVWRGPMLGKMLQHFSNDVIWGDIEYTIFDLPPGTGDIALDIHQMLPHCKEILVTTPHHTATHVAERAGSMAVKTNHEILGIVENMSSFTCPVSNETYNLFGEGGGQTLANHFNVPLLASLPMEVPNKTEKINRGLYDTSSSIGSVYEQLAKQVMAQAEGN